MKKLDSIDAYPLDWPDENRWPRTENPERSNFHTKKGRYGTRPKTVAEARRFCVEEIERLGGENIIISTNIRVRKDGMPYSNAAEPDDSGVAIYFLLDGEPQVFPNDKWDRVADNIYAIGKTIEALRGIDRWGTHSMGSAVFTGFKALPEEGTGAKWWKVLDVDRDAAGEEIKKAFKQRIKDAHPDRGGSTEEFQRVRKAFDQAKESTGVS